MTETNKTTAKGCRILTAGMAMLLCVASAEAQLHGSVSVEGEYAPEIIEVERINVFPRQVRFDMPARNLDFERGGVVTGFEPRLLTMGVTGWRSRREPDFGRGYVDMQLGSWLNSNLSAGARVLSDSVQRLGVSLQFNSSSLYRAARRESAEDNTSLTRSRRALYDGNIALDYSRVFGGRGVLDSRIGWRLGYFNYYNSPVAPGSKAPSQTLNAVDVDLGWHSEGSGDSRWNVGLEAGYFGYRALAMPSEMAGMYEEYKGDRETRIALDGGYVFDFDDRSSIVIDADFSLMLYSASRPDGPAWLPCHDKSLQKLTPSDYGMLTLRPRYRFRRSNLDIQIGAAVDLCFNAHGDNTDDHYSLLHVAPDLKADYRSGYVGLHASIGGGSRLNTLSSLSRYDYYQMPVLVSTQPSYTPLDLVAGLDFGPFSGFTAGFSWGYDVTLHTRTGGWYQAMLADAMQYEESVVTDGVPLYGMARRGVDLHGMKAILDLEYRMGSRLSVSARGEYVPQNGRKGVFNGYDRARWNVTAALMWRPVDKLRVDLSYNLRGVRNVYMYCMEATPGTNLPTEELRAYRLPDLHLLQASLTYSPLRNLDISCHAYNMLDRRTLLLPSLPGEGVCVTGGLTVRF